MTNCKRCNGLIVTEKYIIDVRENHLFSRCVNCGAFYDRTTLDNFGKQYQQLNNIDLARPRYLNVKPRS